MAQKSGPVLRLTGELRWRGADWDLAELRSLHQRLGDNLAKAGTVTRYIRYNGEYNGRTEVRFFGIQVDSTAYIPEGMIALELGNDNITVLKPLPAGPSTAWQGRLTWDWLDRSAPGAPVGEFRARVPTEWTSQPEARPIEFILATNSYFEKGKTTDDDVRLVEYDPLWPAKFGQMADWLHKNIPPEILLRVEHFGSTAIPDMPAKPVIDILLEIPSFDEGRRSLIPLFNKPECEYWWSDDHMAFYIRKELMGTRTHHIHAVPAGKRSWRWIVFRDYLRSHPDEAARYAALKHELAGRYATDREEYTDAKGSFVQEIIAKALKDKSQ